MTRQEQARGMSPIFGDMRMHPGRSSGHVLRLVAPRDVRYQPVIDDGHTHSVRCIKPSDVSVDIGAAHPKALVALHPASSVHKDKDGPLRSSGEKEVEPVPRRMAADTIPVWDVAEDLLFGQVCILIIQLDADPLGDRAARHDKAQHRAEKQRAEMITSSTGHGHVDRFLSLYGWRDAFGCGRLSREARVVRGASDRA